MPKCAGKKTTTEALTLSPAEVGPKPSASHSGSILLPLGLGVSASGSGVQGA